MSAIHERTGGFDVVAGFLAAATAVAILATAISGSGWFGFQVFLGASAHAWVVGWPLYVALRDFGRASALNIALAGFVTGALPVALALLPHFYDPQAAAIGGDDRVFGVLPLVWSNYAMVVFCFGLGGVVAAVVFWLTVRALTTNRPAIAPGKAAGFFVVIWPLGFFFALLPLYSLRNFVIHDASCHNPFRDRAFFDDRLRTIAPLGGHSVKALPSEWSRLRSVLRAYGQENGLNIIDRSSEPDPTYMSFYMSLCEDSGTQIMAIGSSSTMASASFAQDRIDVAVFETRTGSRWKEHSARLKAVLETNWPEQKGKLDPGPEPQQRRPG